MFYGSIVVDPVKNLLTHNIVSVQLCILTSGVRYRTIEPWTCVKEFGKLEGYFCYCFILKTDSTVSIRHMLTFIREKDPLLSVRN